MKIKQLFIYTACATFFLSACKKEDTNVTTTTPPKDGNLNIVFDNMVGTDPVVMSQLSFLNAAGNTYSVSLLKYYVSNIELHKKGGSVVKPGNYELINAADPASCTFNVGNLSAGDYDTMVFYIGIDPT
ncbi:MAG: MbnP family protein, partial [Chitinophagaceae bacterium]